jgi:hypothetical protein
MENWPACAPTPQLRLSAQLPSTLDGCVDEVKRVLEFHLGDFDPDLRTRIINRLVIIVEHSHQLGISRAFKFKG